MNQPELIPAAPRRSFTEADIAELRAKLSARSVPVPECGCVLWEHGVTTAGYGGIYYGPPRKQFLLAHRAAWVVANGAIPDDVFVCHRCDTRRCVNPAHLFLGTPLDNMRDMIAKGRQDFQAGERNSNAKLTDADVIAMRLSGLNSTDAGRAFGVSDSVASRILNGHTWRHLPMFPEAKRAPRRLGVRR